VIAGIRRAGSADPPVMAAIHAASFPPHDTWDQDFIGRQLSVPGTFGLLHPGGGVLLARVAADEAEILTIGVVPVARGTGIGSALLRDSFVIAAAAGATAMFLEVSVNNQPARIVYEKLGFKAAGQRKTYYPDGSDALVLRRGLSEPLSALSGSSPG
jgi:ribosomal-protein-alanine N-acetyltransferase